MRLVSLIALLFCLLVPIERYTYTCTCLWCEYYDTHNVRQWVWYGTTLSVFDVNYVIESCDGAPGGETYHPTCTDCWKENWQ